MKLQATIELWQKGKWCIASIPELDQYLPEDTRLEYVVLVEAAGEVPAVLVVTAPVVAATSLWHIVHTHSQQIAFTSCQGCANLASQRG